MGSIIGNAKRQYQKMLEKKALADRERGKTIIVPDASPAAVSPLCFGVIGTGHVFDRWMHDMRMLPSSAGIRVKGVAVGKSDTAKKKAYQYGIPVVYSSFDEMLLDPEIQAVYIATPNHLHGEHVTQALHAGKHVLCEKPIAVNVTELKNMYDVADAADCFLMEGLWMRTLPMIHKLAEITASGEIGTVRYIETTCCNANAPDKYPSLYNAERAGGALMDVGCYGLHFIRMFLGGTPKLSSSALLTSEGVDHTSSALLHYKDAIAVITQSIGAAGGANATLHGTKGTVEVPMFLSPAGFTVIDANGFKTYYRYEKEKDARPIGYAYEILHFADCIGKGLRDSEWIPRSETIAVAEQMEQIRRENEIILGSERNGR